ncbi:Bax inhibitor-1 family protein [Myxococcota bacterium]|nr:Bax inhibitor-1 family protein [Myxococcota bacterium]
MYAHATSTVLNAPAAERADYLRKVATWTFGGLAITGVTGVASALLVAPAVFRMGTIAVLVLVYGSFFFSQTIARRMVYGDSKVAGFVLGTVAQGLALGFLLLVTVAMGGVADGLGVIVQCMALTTATALGMLMYVWTTRSEFSMLRAGLSVLFLPMLALMALQLVFPLGGALGLLVSAVFVLVSAGALLYSLNQVVHTMDTSMEMEGGFEITIAIVVLFWNLLTLLNRLRR